MFMYVFSVLALWEGPNFDDQAASRAGCIWRPKSFGPQGRGFGEGHLMEAHAKVKCCLRTALALPSWQRSVVFNWALRL